jgi:hypothetical protein
MCNGFGGYVTQDGQVLFCEPDSNGDCPHSKTDDRLNLREPKSEFLKSRVKFQFPDWTEGSFEWDEGGTLPGWVNDEHKESAVKVFLRVAPAWAEYDKVRDQAWAEFITTISTITGYVPEK